MQCNQYRWSPETGWRPELPTEDGSGWLLAFADRTVLSAWGERWEELSRAFPSARLVGCSTAGEIVGPQVVDGEIVVTAVEFSEAGVSLARCALEPGGDHRAAGRALARQLPAEGMRHLFVLSDGLVVNGSELAAGLREGVPDGVAVTGGLAGDGADFGVTHVVCDGEVLNRGVVAVGLYGEALQLGYGSFGGWDPFGVNRRITRAEGNVLYELDGESALDLYRHYLGEHAANLPASGLLFPLSVTAAEGGPELVRTLLAIDEESGAMTFAGDLPEGGTARLMKANFDRLVDGASQAAEGSRLALGDGGAELAILISCVGRRLVLDQRVEEELEEVEEVLGSGASLAGFYSYGEICPVKETFSCELHNQTMTITTLAEAER